MKNLGNLLGVLGILLLVYSVIGRFVGDATIGLAIVEIQASSGLILANGLMLISVLIKLTAK